MSVVIRGWRSSTAPIRWTSKVIVPPVIEPVTLEELKKLARITSNDEDVILDRFIRAARNKVEQDTGLALLTQTRALYLDRLPGVYDPFLLPFSPLQAVESVEAVAYDGTTSTVDAANYVVSDGWLSLADEGAWPTDLRSAQPFTVTVRVGYESVDDIPEALVQAVGLLATHYATTGRDVFAASTLITAVPLTYDDCIAPFKQVVLA